MIDYPHLVNWAKSNRTLSSAIPLLNKALTWLGYASYALVVLVAAFLGGNLIIQCIAVPAVSFLLVTALRAGINETRPYIKLGYTPLIPKSNEGKSFPSRHSFCMFMIAASWLNLAVKTAWGYLAIDAFTCVLFASAVILAAIRVISGVHYLKDVIAGALIALVLAHIGYMMIFA